VPGYTSTPETVNPAIYNNKSPVWFEGFVLSDFKLYHLFSDI
jgi:hypothetical protein